MGEQFDAIVVGAGVSGAAAALALARAHRKVLILERSSAPGGSGPSIGLLRGHELAIGPVAIPGFPLERTIVEERVIFLEGAGGASFEFRDQSRLDPTASVRSAWSERSAAWLTAQAVEAGATLRTGQAIRSLEGDPVTGVTVQGQTITAPVTIITDLSALPAPSQGTVPGPEWRVEETFRLPPRSIERRLSVRAGEGATLEYILPTDDAGRHAMGFLLPARDALVAGVSVGPDAPLESAEAAFRRFTSHPLVAPYLAGGEPAAHRTIRREFPGPTPAAVGGGGYLRAGEALGLDDPSGAFAPGLGAAMRSGTMAGEVVARVEGRAARSVARAFSRALRSSGIASAMRSGRTLHRALQTNPRLHAAYPSLMNRALHELMAETGARKVPIVRTLRAVRRSTGPAWSELARDAITAGKVL